MKKHKKPAKKVRKPHKVAPWMPSDDWGALGEPVDVTPKKSSWRRFWDWLND